MEDPKFDLELQQAQIPDTRYLGIGTVSEVCKVPQHVLRYWETQFNQLKPMRRGGKRRHYTKEDVYLILKLKVLLKHNGYTIDGARDYLNRESENPPTIHQSAGHKIEQAVANLKRVRHYLSAD